MQDLLVACTAGHIDGAALAGAVVDRLKWQLTLPAIICIFTKIF